MIKLRSQRGIRQVSDVGVGSLGQLGCVLYDYNGWDAVMHFASVHKSILCKVILLFCQYYLLYDISSNTYQICLYQF